MSMPASPGYQPPGQGSSGGTDIVTSIQGLIRQFSASNQNMLSLIAAIEKVFPLTLGSFTLAAAASTVVTQPAIKANSFVVWVPTNAAAGTLLGSAKNLYLSALTAGASFTVTTASGANAAGTETFLYAAWTP